MTQCEVVNTTPVSPLHYNYKHTFVISGVVSHLTRFPILPNSVEQNKYSIGVDGH